MKVRLNIDLLKEIYLISNTAPFLYNSFKREGSISNLSKISTNSLIKEFKELCAKEINELEELVYAYALFISILEKSDDASFNFAKSSTINFEWFPAIKEIILSNIKPYSISTIVKVKPPKTKANYKEVSTIETELQEFIV